MKITKAEKINALQKMQIMELWNNEYPVNLIHNSIESFESYLEKLSNISHILLIDDEKIIGWAIQFIRDSEVWFAIIISEKFHGNGFGTKILNELKKYNTVLNGWVIDHNNDKKMNGNYYKSPLEFYLKNDFEIVHDVRLELEIMSAVKIIWENK